MTCLTMWESSAYALRICKLCFAFGDEGTKLSGPVTSPPTRFRTVLPGMVGPSFVARDPRKEAKIPAQPREDQGLYSSKIPQPLS